jgi:2-hydroxychromene-2-carboxylate isomerase
LRFPPAHPFNPLPALRLALAAENRMLAIDMIFRHIWEHGLAADSVEALQPLAGPLVIADIATAIASDTVKRELAGNGEQAIALQIFGVPTLVIDQHLFWGNDSTGMALRYLQDPGLFDESEMARISRLPMAIQRPGARA